MHPTLSERVAIVNEKAAAAHARVDKLEAGIREDLAEIKNSLASLAKETKNVNDWMNRAKGWAAAGLFVAGILGVVGGVLARLL